MALLGLRGAHVHPCLVPRDIYCGAPIDEHAITVTGKKVRNTTEKYHGLLLQ